MLQKAKQILKKNAAGFHDNVYGLDLPARKGRRNVATGEAQPASGRSGTRGNRSVLPCPGGAKDFFGAQIPVRVGEHSSFFSPQCAKRNVNSSAPLGRMCSSIIHGLR